MQPLNDAIVFARYASALLGAALAVAGLFALAVGPRLVSWVFAVALAHAVFLGLPAYLGLRAARRESFWWSLAGGFFVGAMPITLVIVLSDLAIGVDKASGGVATVVSGIPTAAGWLEHLRTLIQLGILGAAGAGAFRLVLHGVGGAPRRAGDPPGPCGARRGSDALRPGLAFTLALLATARVLSVPTTKQDTSCHGSASFGPVRLIMDLDLGHEEWPRLVHFFADFGRRNGYFFRGNSADRQDGRLLYLSLCRRDVLNIEVNEVRWADQGYRAASTGGGVSIGFYSRADRRAWSETARRLRTELASAWPGRVRFHGQDGRLSPTPIYFALRPAPFRPAAAPPAPRPLAPRKP